MRTWPRGCVRRGVRRNAVQTTKKVRMCIESQDYAWHAATLFRLQYITCTCGVEKLEGANLDKVSAPG
jgi:hypothetical protein